MNQPEYEKICFFLGQTYSAKNPAQQKDAEDELQKMSKFDEFAFLKNLGQIMMDPNVIGNSKKKKLMRMNISEKEQKFFRKEYKTKIIFFFLKFFILI